MLFELSNAPTSFQGYINKIFTKKLGIFVVIYLDNILIYTENLGQPHIKAMQSILDQLWKYCLYANLKKCQFYKDEV